MTAAPGVFRMPLRSPGYRVQEALACAAAVRGRLQSPAASRWRL